MADDSLSPLDVSAFIVRIVHDAEAIHRRYAVSAALVSYPKADIRALAQARAMLEAMGERRDGKRTETLLDGLAAIAEIRQGAEAIEETVRVTVSKLSVNRLRECFPFFIEYEVLWEKDRAPRSSRGRR